MVDLNTPAWVYLMRNQSMPNMVKIGHTTVQPEERAKQLSVGTVVPTGFYVVRAFPTQWPVEAEKEAHRQLSYCRVNPNREFFNATVPDHMHFASDADFDEYFSLVVANAVEYTEVQKQIELLTERRFQLLEEHERKRQAFLWERMKANYPERTQEVLEAFRKISPMEKWTAEPETLRDGGGT